MTETRRTVRATREFFADLDAQLPSERGPNGEPSTNDFQVVELFPIIERFAVGFDQLPRLVDDNDRYRVLVMTGVLVARIAVTAQLSADEAVELVALDLDLGASWD